MTSSDRHASHDSPYRTGQHMPLNQSRHAPLTSVATSGMESRTDLTSPYNEEASQAHRATNGPNDWSGSPHRMQSPTSPYSPGMRSSAANAAAATAEPDPFDGQSSGEIQMQSFQEGLPPPPPVTHSWKRIDRWVEESYEELYDNLSEGCTQNDINELEHELDCSLPIEVRESLQCHDGQERGGQPTGIIFGCMLLDCEEIVQEWRNWRTVNEEYLNGSMATNHSIPAAKSTAAASSSAGPSSRPHSQSSSSGPNPFWRQELLDKQDSQPPRAIQRAYAHAGWIPLARDWGGNNLAVDLAPGPNGKWGQIIIFGRDYDCKYVVARSWAALLATVADDIASDKVFVDEDTQELKLREFKAPGVEPPYLDILRWRMDQKYGRRPPKKRPGPPAFLPQPAESRRGSHHGSRAGSPYTNSSPVLEERGRSPRRFSGNVGSVSQTSRHAAGAGQAKASPLSQVADLREGLPSSGLTNIMTAGLPSAALSGERPEKLVEAPTPTIGGEDGNDDLAETTSKNLEGTNSGDLQHSDGVENKENSKRTLSGLGVDGLDGLRTVAI